MATSTIKTIGLIALIFLILFFFLNIVAGIFGVLFGSHSFVHIWNPFAFIGNFNPTILGFPMPWFLSQMVPLGLLVLWIVVILWVYKDAEQRNMNGVLWGLLVFVGNIIGLLIYLIVRNEEISHPVSSASASAPKSSPCPSCRAEVKAGFAFCPHCGSKMKKECPNCRKPVSNEWQLCPFCGEKLESPASGAGE